MSEPSFLHFCRRALQEQVAAINAACDAAEAAHRLLCAFQAGKARTAAPRVRRRRHLETVAA
ncbi:hypothetical protein BH10PSE15_BH10PSE15_10270 [soil metagenome]